MYRPELVCVTIPLNILTSMSKIINYGIADEQKDFEASADRTEHIFNDYELVNRFLRSQELQADIDSHIEMTENLAQGWKFIVMQRTS